MGERRGTSIKPNGPNVNNTCQARGLYIGPKVNITGQARS